MQELTLVRGKIFTEILQKDLSKKDYLHISDILSAQVVTKQQLYFLKKKKAYLRHWDGRQRFLKFPDMTFPGGLTQHLLKKLDADFKVTLLDESQDIFVPEPFIDGLKEDYLGGDFTYRDYQLEIMKSALRAKRCLIPAATNAGKTEMLIGLTKIILNESTCKVEYKNPRVLYLVPNSTLLNQTHERYINRGVTSVGMFGDSHEDLESTIIIATASMLHARMKAKNKWCRRIHDFLNNCVLFIGDEFHKGSSASWMNIAENTKAVYRFGVSGTVIGRNEVNNMLRMSMTGEPLEGVTNDQLIQAGHSAKPTVILHDMVAYSNNFDGLPYGYVPESQVMWYDGFDFQEAVLMDVDVTDKESKESWIELEDGTKMGVKPETLLNKHHAYDFSVCIFPKRNELILEDCLKYIEKDYKILIFIEKTAHGRLLKNMLTDNGVAVEFVYGKSSTESRAEALGKIKSGELSVIVASSIFNEGVDLPDFRVIINAAGGKADTRLLQKIGRGLRKKGDDNTVILIDFIDAQNVYTMEHSVIRVEEYENQKFDMTFV